MSDYWKFIKQSFASGRNLSLIGFAEIVGGGLSAIFWFYLASQIDPEQYGVIHYFLGIAGIAQLCSMIGSPNVITVYTAKKLNTQSTLFFLSIITGVISGIIVYVTFQKIEVSFLILGYVIFELGNAYLIGKKKFENYTKILLSQKGLTLILGLSFYFIFGIDGIIPALVISYIPYIGIMINEFRKSRISFSLLKPRKGFLINNYTISLTSAVAGQIDKIIIAPLIGFELLGNYSLVMQFLIVLIIVPQVIFRYLLTQDSSGKNTKNLKIVTILISIVLTIFGIIVLPGIISEFFPKYVDSIDAIQIISLVVIPSTITLILESKFLALEKSRFLLISRMTSVGILILGFISLGPVYGIIGLAVSLILSSSFQSIFLYVISKKMKAVSPMNSE